MSGAAIHVVSNGELRAGWSPDPAEDPESIAVLSAAKRAALLANPLLGSDEEPARLLAREDGRIVGRLDLVAGELETPAGPVACFWGSALHVSARMRGRGLGAMLLRAAEEHRESAAACAPSRMSHPLYGRLGYLDLPLRRHLLVTRTGPLVERWLGRVPGRRAVAAAADAVAAGQRRALGLVRKTRVGELRLEQVETFPHELEPRLREREAPYSMHRSAAWLDWIVRESFGAQGHRRALYLVTDPVGDVLAYILVKARRYSGVTRWKLDDLRLGSLVDWRIFDPSAVRLEQLVLLALGALDDWGLHAFEVCAAEPVALRRYGFVPAGAQHVMIRATRGSTLAPDQGAWTVRPGEGDHAFS